MYSKPNWTNTGLTNVLMLKIYIKCFTGTGEEMMPPSRRSLQAAKAFIAPKRTGNRFMSSIMTTLPAFMVAFAMLAALPLGQTAHTMFKENQTCVRGTYPPNESKKVKDYVINLDLPPEERWKDLASEKKQELAFVLKTFKTYITEFGTIFKEILQLLDDKGPLLVETLPQPYQDEMKGIANATGLEIGEIALYNIFYELFTLCTSIVAEDENGKMYHARNLDFGLFLGWDIINKQWKTSEALRPSVVNVDFQKSGKTVYKAVTFAGYIGIITGVAPGKFSLTLNERFNTDGGYIGIVEKIVTGKGKWMGFLTRETLESAQSYDQAVSALSKVQLIAPAYYIVGGISSGQGCVITRNRIDNNTDIWPMKAAGGWFVLQTNYDHSSAPLFLDDRRTPGIRCMNKLSQKNLSYEGLFDVLSSQPVLNKLTVYTALMQVETGHLETWLQYCKDPCTPW